MAYEQILSDMESGVQTITVNRPDKLNALNPTVLGELEDAVRASSLDPEVTGIILTGAGEKAFVAGADIHHLSGLNSAQAKAEAEQGQSLSNLLEHCPKPTVAAVNGFALGGGCELAMACQMRIASSNARFGQPEVLLGVIPGFGGTQRLPRLIGKGRALELLLTGDPIKADEAFRIGLVNRVVEQEELLPACRKIVETIASRGPVAVRYVIEAVNRGLEMTLKEGMNYEANLFGLLFSTDDQSEGMKAFIEKREADFAGK